MFNFTEGRCSLTIGNYRVSIINSIGSYSDNYDKSCVDGIYEPTTDAEVAVIRVSDGAFLTYLFCEELNHGDQVASYQSVDQVLDIINNVRNLTFVNN